MRTSEECGVVPMPGGIYAPMIHPWSSGRDVYFTLALWSATT
jgi:hypothetical protein